MILINFCCFQILSYADQQGLFESIMNLDLRGQVYCFSIPPIIDFIFKIYLIMVFFPFSFKQSTEQILLFVVGFK